MYVALYGKKLLRGKIKVLFSLRPVLAVTFYQSTTIFRQTRNIFINSKELKWNQSTYDSFQYILRNTEISSPNNMKMKLRLVTNRCPMFR